MTTKEIDEVHAEMKHRSESRYRSHGRNHRGEIRTIGTGQRSMFLSLAIISKMAPLLRNTIRPLKKF